eukprot:TRINITY_DN5011_c0_g1_i5.p1 TRINITY_DN5011_c0_g1~~TRINITY_DN5011_c0_g1_i5.p1  ORF type:complete len:289 (+),score=-18.00 TRINITY_DN5011_c0_g1_i5:222-1088(+)
MFRKDNIQRSNLHVCGTKLFYQSINKLFRKQKESIYETQYTKYYKYKNYNQTIRLGFTTKFWIKQTSPFVRGNFFHVQKRQYLTKQLTCLLKENYFIRVQTNCFENKTKLAPSIKQYPSITLNADENNNHADKNRNHQFYDKTITKTILGNIHRIIPKSLRKSYFVQQGFHKKILSMCIFLKSHKQREKIVGFVYKNLQRNAPINKYLYLNNIFTTKNLNVVVRVTSQNLNSHNYRVLFQFIEICLFRIIFDCIQINMQRIPVMTRISFKIIIIIITQQVVGTKRKHI